MPETTDTLRWTALRHRMLRRIASSGVLDWVMYWCDTGAYDEDDWYDSAYGQLSADEKRAARALHQAGLVQAPSGQHLTLTDAGRVLLSRWDAEHPEGGAG